MDATDRAEQLFIVDDEEEIRLSLCDFLEHEGFQVIVAANGAEALKLLDAQFPRVVISDLMMPDVDGIQFLEELTKRKINIPVIIMTAFGTMDHAIQAMKKGASDFITKPIDLDYLLQTIRRVIDRSKMSEKIKEQQQQLIQSEKMASLGQLVAGIAHEINNPINFIISNLQPLKEYLHGYKNVIQFFSTHKETLPDELRHEFLSIYTKNDIDFINEDSEKLLQSFEDGSHRISGIVASLRQYSRVDVDYYSPFDLHEAIDSSLRLLHTRYKQHITVRKNYGNLPPVICSPGQINQVFLNILSNAEEAVEGNGHVWIITTVENGMAVIRIRDDGKGIPANIQKKIFDPFFTTKPVGSGTGLGLSISYGIIEQHGGTIAVDSEVGKGTTFTVKLPTQNMPRAAIST
jgi:signal transduction histidine kinase